MNLQSLKAAGEFARMYGCKCLIFGPPGSAKTPLINTAPRPLLLSCEGGLLSMRGSKVPTFQAFTGDAIDDFFDWFFSSNDIKNFDTLAIDSISHMCEIYLQDALSGKSKSGNKAHGLAAYGLMANNVMKHMRRVFFMEQKHTYIIAKECIERGMKWPYFPGKMLDTEIPHIPDFILHLSVQNVPNVGQTLAFRCNQSIDVLARNRTGNLNDFEKPHFGELVARAMRA